MSGKLKKTNNIVHSLGIGTILREIRNNLGLTLEEVSNETGIADETIRRIEKDIFEPKLSTLEILSDFYRVDLIELAARKRLQDSIFSEDLISKVNKYINAQDFDALKKFADEHFKKVENQNDSLGVCMNTFMYSLKYIKYNPDNGQNDTIAILEDTILKISPYYLDANQLVFPFPLEMSIILLLAVLYRQNKCFDKAINLLYVTISRILSMPLINDRFSDFLSVAYVNLAYTFHSKGEHLKVIDVVNECLSNVKINYTNTTFSHLLFRKGLAMHLLQEPNAKAILVTSLLLMDEKTKEQLVAHLKENYNLILKVV